MILIKDHLKQHAPLGISALLGLMILFTLIFTLQHWHSDWTFSHQSLPEKSPALAKNESVDIVNTIAEKHIFGQDLVESDNMPLTHLQLQVTGIVMVATEDAKSISKAYISAYGQSSKIYQPGDSLPHGVKIYDIKNDAVILENNGQLEKLPLLREKLQFKPRNRMG